MPAKGLKNNWIRRLAKFIFAGSVFLLPVENVFALADLTTSNATFASIDDTRSYMDSAGTWNSSTNTEATNSTGDNFAIIVSNTGTTAAQDVDITVDLPSGFRLPFNNYPIAVSAVPGTCDISGFGELTANQSGNTLNFGIPNNRDIAAGCTYTFAFGLTTDPANPATPSPALPPNTLTYNLRYDDGGPAIIQPVLQNITVNNVSIGLSKTADTVAAANGQFADFTVTIRNDGSGGIFDAVLTDTISANLSNLTFTSVQALDALNNPVALPSNFIAPNQYQFPYIPPNVRFVIGVRTQVSVDPAATTCPDLTNNATVVTNRTGNSASGFDTIDFNLANSLQLTHDLTNSFCELCGIGEVFLTVENTGGLSLENIVVTEDLLASGLTYVANSTSISTDGGLTYTAAANPEPDPFDPTNAQRFRWTPSLVPELARLDSPFALTPAFPTQIVFRFQVRRETGLSEEGLSTAIRDIQASATYGIVCNGLTQTATGAAVELPIRQAVPQTFKLGRNLDAGQNVYDANVYGHEDDDVIWRVEVQNDGLADMEDLLVDDAITGNFDINWTCISEASAIDAATGNPAPAGCDSAGNNTVTSTTLVVDDPYGTPGDDEPGAYTDSPTDYGTNGPTYLYFVGRVRGVCSNVTNTANIEWGCEADSQAPPPSSFPEGGLIAPATTGGVAPAFTRTASADLGTQVVSGGLNIAQAITGTNGTQPPGSKGLVTITVENLTGGTVRDLVLTDLLPTQYVMDVTAPVNLTVAPAYGNAYPGMTDTVTHLNPFPVTPSLLSNVEPVFELTSSTTSEAGDSNLLRHGDILTIEFTVVLVEAPQFDLQADLDVAPEEDGPVINDPPQTFDIDNRVTLAFDDVCPLTTTAPAPIVNNDTFTANPEDLDVTISDALFILTNDTGTPLSLHVDLTNNGGHTADDYYLYVSLGQAMVVQTAPSGVPAGCSPANNPPLHPVFNTTHPTWSVPDAIPGPLSGDPPAAVYVCYRGAIAPGATERFTFDVVKQPLEPGPPPADDLTFRADVIGEITLTDGQELVYPAPGSTSTAPAQQLANNYSLDAVRSRVLGFNLTQTAWYCTESGNPEPTAPTQQDDLLPPYPLPTELNTQIGEDCHYFIESGGWFGFVTPGFTLIEVQDVDVTANLLGVPVDQRGQGFIPYDLVDAYDFHQTGGIVFDSLPNAGAGTTDLDQSDITWSFNTATGITVREEYFRVNYKTRLLNDDTDLVYPVPGGYAPNLHGRTSTNIATTSFRAIFQDSTTGLDLDILVDENQGVPGYPVPAVRQVDLVEVEPNLIVTKEVCNETLYGREDHVLGTTCSNYATSISDGDTNDSYVYRITMENETTAPIRSPAYDVIVRDVLDSSDLMLVEDFLNDDLDNDDDGQIDEADEGTIVTNNIVADGIAAEIEFDFNDVNTATQTLGRSLLRIDSGQIVTLYYRVDPDDAIEPLQPLINTVTTRYDSLEGDFGNQNDPQFANTYPPANNIGGARHYTAIDAAATVRMEQLQTQPKQIISVANSVIGPGTQEVVVGEEILYELSAQIPVANLRNFTITDVLPPGLSCVDYQTVNLDEAPYVTANFFPGGIIGDQAGEVICDGDRVQWNFRNQELRSGAGFFDFRVRFIARVENTDDTDNDCLIRNGGASTGTPAPCSGAPSVATLSYDETFSNPGFLTNVTLVYSPVDVVVREPRIEVSKSFAVAETDADDILTVTVTVTNPAAGALPGTAPAYNVEILDDLTGTNMTYIGNVGGPNAPNDDGIVTPPGSNQPVFSWDRVSNFADFEVSVGETLTFTYQVQVNPGVQPQELLTNTIEAKWTSLPGTDSALNDIDNDTPRTLAADGSALGMRNGYFPATEAPPAIAANDYLTSNFDEVLVPELTIAKAVVDPATDPLISDSMTIGEHQRFQITVTLPEGITNNLSITDNLDNLGAAGERYVIENNATYDISYNFPGIAAINTLAPSEGAFVDNTANITDGFPVDGEADGSVSWDIGDIDTDSEDDSIVNIINPEIFIDYYARINNDTDTDAGDNLQNNATLFYDNATGVQENRSASTSPITVVEPQLVVDKVVTNTTNPGIAPDAGDVLQYVITIEHDPAITTNQSSAFDVNIQDNIPAGVVYDAGSASITIDGVAAGDVLPLNAATGPLVWGRTNTATTAGGDQTLDILYNETTGVGQQLVLTYTVTVQDSVEPNQDLNGSVVVDWTSLNGANPLERTGIGGAACVIVPPNDYCVSDDAPIAVPNLNNISKAANNDTWLPGNDGQLRIGDQLEYTLTLNLQEGTTTNIQLLDELPDGMEFVGIVSINDDTGTEVFPDVFEYSDAAVPFEYVGDNIIASGDISAQTGDGPNIVTFNIGDVINHGVGDNNSANDEFVIVYTAQVVNDELPIPQSPSTPLTNFVNFNYDDVANVGVTQTSSANITALQPQILLADISKERFTDSGYGTSVPSGSAAPSGSTVYFRLQTCNSGDAPAYDVIIQDDLNPIAGTSIPQPPLTSEFDLNSINGLSNGALRPDVYINGVLLSEDTGAGGDYTYDFTGSIMTFELTGTAIPPVTAGNNCVTIEYNVQVDATLGGGNTWDNTLQVNSYASINATEPNTDLVLEREIYDTVVGPVLHNLHNFTPLEDPAKAFVDVTRPDINPPPLTARAATDAAVGELVTYRIVVPENPMNGSLNNVVILDYLDESLAFESATLVFDPADALDYGSAPGETITPSIFNGNDVRIALDATLQGLHQATVDLVARVDNNATTDLSTAPFNNNVQYQFTNSAAPTLTSVVATLPANDISVVEPQLDTVTSPPTITVTNTTKALPAVDAGDVLEYTITYGFLGGAAGDAYSDAYDVSITSTLSPGLSFVDGSTSSSIGTFSNPTTSGQVLTWDIAAGTNIDIPEGTSGVTFTYRLRVDDAVLANQALNNTSVIRWSSLDSSISDLAETNERDGAGGVDDYFSSDLVANVTSTDTNTVTKVYAGDTSPQLNAANVPSDVRIGDWVDYRITLNLQEGTSGNVTLRDQLPQGMVFEEVLTINGVAAPYTSPGSPFSYTIVPATLINVTGDPATGPTTVTWTLGDIVNEGFDAAPDDGNNDFVIVYRARILDHPPLQPIANPLSPVPLRNDLAVDYDADSTTGITVQTIQANETVAVQQPNLSVTSKLVAPAGGDNIIDANEVITYTVEIQNNGAAPAYDVVVRDTLPFGLRQSGVVDMQVELPAGTVIPQATEDLIVTSYDVTTGVIEWNFDTGVADSFTIGAGQSLRITYNVQADAGIGAGLTAIANSVQVYRYYSFDDEALPDPASVVDDREVYGPSAAFSSPSLRTQDARPLLKTSSSATAAIGVPFTYTITIPDDPTLSGGGLYDVRILDDLGDLAPGVDLIYVNVQDASGTASWTPVNTGSATDLVIEDVTNGIDIPAGQQAVINITVLLRDTSNNADGDVFTNTASYTYNVIDNDPTTRTNGGGDSATMTVVEPLTMVVQKTGPPNITYGTPATFTIDVHNADDATAYDLTVTDHLPDPVPGGMCDVAPADFTAEIRDNLGAVQRTLTAGTDFSTAFTPATSLAGVPYPTCTLTMTMESAAAGIEPGWHLLVSYSASLDVDNNNNAPLTNFAAATQWFSGDTPAGVDVGEIRTYEEVFDPVDPGTPTVTDYQDVYTTTVTSPELVIEKTVINTATGAPAITAEPGETLTYTITVTNVGPIDALNIVLTDEPDRLNSAPGYFSNMVENPLLPLPSGASIDPAGGVNGTGLLTYNVPSLAAGASLSISFNIDLIPVITSGTLVLNQAEVSLTGFTSLLSDDPSIPGTDDPTQTIIGSMPIFDVKKTSQDLTNEPNVLRRGDILRYTITAKNIGAENSVSTLFRDQIPANTAYVTNTTTLNGVPVADVGGISPLQNGMLINAPEDSTPGFMRADPDPTNTGNVATITFNVIVNDNVVNGTVISNQGFVSGEGAGSGPYAEQPSDNPDTVDIPNDPTVDVVGNLPIVDAQKTVSLVVDNGTPNVVDIGDELEYEIVITNAGVIPATGVVLRDNIHGIDTNSNYVPNSITLNGAPVADSSDVRPGAGQLLIIDINSSDLPNPDQSLSNGQLSPGGSARVTFRIVATDADAASSIIANQGDIESTELPTEPTDADGNDENGDQPTTIAIGEESELSISKEVFVVGGGVAQPGGQLEYVIQVRNTGSVDASNIAFTDTMPAGVTYVPDSTRLNGSSAFNSGINVTEPGASLDIDVQSAIGPLEPDDAFTVAFRVTIDSALSPGSTISNTASVSWSENPEPVTATISIDVGGAPGVANLNGRIWHDADHSDDFGNSENPLEGWSVEIYMNGQYLDEVLSDINGLFSVNGLAPSSGIAGNEYELRFLAPGAGANTASLGMADSIFSPGLQLIRDISVSAGANILGQNLPIEPNGIVYNAVTRAGVAGVQLRLLHQTGLDVAGDATYETVSALCFDDPAQQDQITLASGFYKFDLNFSQSSCPPNGDYFIEVNALSAGYLNAVSQIIPPRNNRNGIAFDVPGCPDDNTVDALETIPDYCEVQASEQVSQDPPRTSTTDYYLKYAGNFTFPDESNQFYNNHIPLDPELDAALSISKTSALVNVVRSQLVPYTITINNTLSVPVYDINIVDNYPAGFKYVKNSARLYLNDSRIEQPITDISRNLNVETIEPQVNGLWLTWPNLIINSGDTTTIKMLLVVGSGVGEGEYINRVRAVNDRTGGNASGEANATVRVVPDPTFDCSDVIGKVFDDANLNGYQDEGEKGIASARVISAQGLEATTDAAGRFHITCAVVPNPDRGSNFILKLDERSLPSGYRVITENPRVQRATRGKMLKYNFGTAIHRVVRLDMADGVFEPGTTEMRPQWKPRLDLLITELAKDPSVLRLSYMAEVEDPDLVDDRVDIVKNEISKRWEEINCCYKLMIETEVFWRTGGPPDRGTLQ